MFFDCSDRSVVVAAAVVVVATSAECQAAQKTAVVVEVVVVAAAAAVGGTEGESVQAAFAARSVSSTKELEALDRQVLVAVPGGESAPSVPMI